MVDDDEGKPFRLTVLLVATVALSASHSAVFPLLADLQDAHDLPTAGLGLIAAGTFIGGLAAQLLLAKQADRGRARLLLVAGPALAALALLGFAFATELWQFVLARTASGIGVGCFLPATRAIVAAYDPTRVGANLGRLSSAELAGLVTGPIISATLADLIGLRAPFIALGLVAALTVPVVARMSVPDLRVADDVPSGPGPMQLLKIRGVLVATLLGLALYFPAGVYEAVWARYLEDLGASTLFIGVSLSLYGIPFVAVAPLGGRTADRYGPVRTATIGLALAAPLAVCYGILDSPWLLVALAMLEAVFNAASVPAAQAAMARACPPGSLATGQGLAGASGLAGAGIAALLAGPVYAGAGSEVLFIGVGVVMGGLAGTVALLSAAERRTGVDLDRRPPMMATGEGAPARGQEPVG